MNTPRMYWTVGQIAELFQVTNGTVRVWIREKKFPNAFRTNGPRGQWRIPTKDVQSLAQKEYGSE